MEVDIYTPNLATDRLKIDRLMEKVDRLEKLKTERDRKQLIIHAAASDRLLNAPDKNSFNDAWNFIQNNFNQLYSVQENVSELRFGYECIVMPNERLISLQVICL